MLKVKLLDRVSRKGKLKVPSKTARIPCAYYFVNRASFFETAFIEVSGSLVCSRSTGRLAAACGAVCSSRARGRRGRTRSALQPRGASTT
jgi:hypothetical protein